MRITPRQLKLGSLPRFYFLFASCDRTEPYEKTDFTGLKGYHEQIGNAKWSKPRDSGFVTMLKLSIDVKGFDAAEVLFVRISSFCPRLYIRCGALRRSPVSGKIRPLIFT